MTEFNSAPPVAADQPGTMGAGADIYRRLDRRPRRSTMKYATPVIALAIILAGGATAYVMLRPTAAPQSALPQAPPAALTTAPQTPAAAQVAATPEQAMQAPVSQPAPPVVHRTERRERVAAQAVRPRPRRAAPRAVSSGEDASAYQPVAPAAPPAATTAAPAQPAPVTLPPPPAPPPSANSAPSQPPS
ncbi:MAG TPA: hypothetical protein VN805_05225 [Caulobacteraceae bacterium]|nr:hypothetical protein [Caulobacteraceae bacterium]